MLHLKEGPYLKRTILTKMKLKKTWKMKMKFIYSLMKSKVNKSQTKNLKTALKKNSRLYYKFVKKGIINFKLVVATVLAHKFQSCIILVYYHVCN